MSATFQNMNLRDLSKNILNSSPKQVYISLPKQAQQETSNSKFNEYIKQGFELARNVTTACLLICNEKNKLKKCQHGIRFDLFLSKAVYL